MKVEEIGKLAWAAIQIATAATMGVGVFGGWLNLPSRVAELEDKVQELAVVRAQMDWVAQVLSDKFKVQPPDLSRFERPRRRRYP